MEITRTFVSKFNEDDEVVKNTLFCKYRKGKVLRVRIANIIEVAIFEYLVEFEDGERHWVSEENLRNAGMDAESNIMQNLIRGE